MTQILGSNVLISGASGMIGSALDAYLTERGCKVYRLSRSSAGEPFYFDASSARVFLDPSIPLSAVINLAGPSIADKRWSAARKREILDSRVSLTHALASALAEAENKPQCLLSASAIGYYGETGAREVDEDSPAGSDFLAEVARDWEDATAPAERAGITTIHLRFGIVLSPTGGVLKNLLLPFRLGLGGRIGSGLQGMSWISLPDAVQIIHRLLIDRPQCGPLNLVAGKAVTNTEFTTTLAQTLRRPHILPLPAFMVKLLLGEMGEALLLGSSRVTSRKLSELGIELQHPTLRVAFEALLR
jgi:uncharacterized protein